MFVWRYLVLFFGFGLIFLPGSVDGKKTSADPVPSSSTSKKSTTTVARIVRWEVPGGTVMQGSGLSMAPIYGENTMVVTTPIEFEDLKAEMIVAYRNRSGELVVHQIVNKIGKKWLAQGINNRTFDRDRVTKNNLVGVVYAVFNSRSSENNTEAIKKTYTKSKREK